MSQPLDLAPVGNGIVAGLFDRLGRCSWLCWPRLDGDPVFCALLNGEAPEDGFMECEMVGLRSSKQTYRRNTAVLETELEDEHGARLRIIDAAPRFRRFPVRPKGFPIRQHFQNPVQKILLQNFFA